MTEAFQRLTHGVPMNEANAPHGIEIAMRSLPPIGQCWAEIAVVMPGTGDNDLLLDSAKQYTTHIVVAGYHKDEDVGHLYTAEALAKKLGRRSSQILTQGATLHAGTQAAWIAERVVEKDLISFTLHTTSFYAQRAWRTVLEALRRLDPENLQKVAVFPTPLIGSLTKKRFRDNSTGKYNALSELENVFGEYERLVTYARPKTDGSPGDVLTPELTLEYLEWLEGHDFVVASRMGKPT